MRILHVTNGLDEHGRYGGVPIVMLALARGLRARGHRVVVASGRTSSIRTPNRVEGIPLISTPVRTPFPRLGAGAQFAPFLLLRSVRTIATADVVHVHFSRDPTSLAAVLLSRVFRRPLVLQTHGMMHEPRNVIGRLLDRAVVPAALAAAHRVLVLTRDEQRRLTRLSPGGRVEVFPNGTRAVPTSEVIPAVGRPDEVLFLARLHPRKGAADFARSAVSVIRSLDTSAVRFVVAGPDEGDLAAVLATISEAGLEDRFDLPGGLSHRAALARLGSSRLYVLPAREEPFGMTVVEAMIRGTPVILHETAELAEAVADRDLGWTFGDEGELSAAMIAALADPQESARRGRAARLYAEAQFSIEAVTDRLLETYRAATHEDASVDRGAPSSDAKVLAAVARARVVVLVPTFRRPEQLAELLAAISEQSLVPSRVVVCDNDPNETARSVCERFDVEYLVEDVPGVARVRTRLVRSVRDEDFFAFIDDDEVPPDCWLRTLVLTAEHERVDVVGAPVTPRYGEATTHWTARFNAHMHGTRPRGRDLVLFPSTNNCLVRRSAWSEAGSLEFDDAFGFSGGEDTDFFWRLRRAGLSLFWEPAGEVEEQVSPDRVSTAWFIRRGMQNGWVHGSLQLREHNRAHVLGGAVVRVGSGAAMAATSVLHRRSPADGLSRMLRGIGFLRAVAELPPSAYARRTSVST